MQEFLSSKMTSTPMSSTLLQCSISNWTFEIFFLYISNLTTNMWPFPSAWQHIYFLMSMTRSRTRISRLADSIPPELKLAIFENLDQQGLLPVIYSSQQFKALATPLLYRNIVIDCTFLEELCCIWLDNPSYPCKVKSLALRDHSQLLARPFIDAESEKWVYCLRIWTKVLQ